MPTAFLNLTFFVIYSMMGLFYHLEAKIEAPAREFPNSSVIIASTNTKQQDYDYYTEAKFNLKNDDLLKDEQTVII